VGADRRRARRDETAAEGLAREIWEETGLDTVSVELFGVFSDPPRIVAYPDGKIFRLLTLAFTVSVADGEPRLSEESPELRWVTVGELHELEFGPAQMPLIEAFLSSSARPVVA
jgi:8-oxo-dGTP pyrophosphatase MutT (NUDIX family)